MLEIDGELFEDPFASIRLMYMCKTSWLCNKDFGSYGNIMNPGIPFSVRCHHCNFEGPIDQVKRHLLEKHMKIAVLEYEE